MAAGALAAKFAGHDPGGPPHLNVQVKELDEDLRAANHIKKFEAD